MFDNMSNMGLRVLPSGRVGVETGVGGRSLVYRICWVESLLKLSFEKGKGFTRKERAILKVDCIG